MQEQKQRIQKDYYIDKNGNIVLTKAFHLKRGFCCGNGCKECPYGHSNVGEKNRKKK